MHDNLRNLGLDALDVVNLRCMFDPHHPAEGSIEAPLTVLADLQRQGLVRHIGLSHVTPTQVAEGRRICKIVCVSPVCRNSRSAGSPRCNHPAWTPSRRASASRRCKSHSPGLLRRSPNILLIPGTSSVAHLQENLAAAECALPDDAISELDHVASIAAA